MEKGAKMDCDSMTTVNVKDFDQHTLDYQDQEPPPAYRHLKTSTTVQVTKIVAIAAVIITAMLSTSLVFSAWVTSNACQQQQQQQPSVPFEALLQPEHLKSILSLGSSPVASVSNDLEQAESKVESNNNGNNSNQESSEEESAEDPAVTMLRLPLEFSLHDHMFERNHRSHMNCVIEKKKAEEIVDEQSKPLPALLGINLTTDPRYLHFTGEKMAISCDSGNDHRQAPQQQQQQQGPVTMHQMPIMMHPSSHNSQMRPSFGNTPPQALNDLLSSALAAAGSSSLPIHIIGPIPLGHGEGPREQYQSESQQFPTGPQSYEQHPFHPHMLPRGFSPRRESQIHVNGPFESLGLPPHLIPVLVPQGNQIIEDSSSASEQSSPSGPFFFGPQGLPQSSETRERALPQPIPIMPRAHVQHVIRPRSVDAKKEQHKRVKRCSCDCACKNHPYDV